MMERSLLMAKNFDVITCFLNKSPSEGAVATDGEELKSYGVVIARWVKENEIVMPDSNTTYDPAISKTIARNRNLVRGMALNRGIIVKEVN